jgi:hypothetical protein
MVAFTWARLRLTIVFAYLEFSARTAGTYSATRIEYAQSRSYPSFAQENFPGPVSAKNSDKKYLKNMG